MVKTRGMSTIIITLLLVVLSIILVVVVWGVVNNTIHQKISSASSCFGNFDKITLNDKYTCYNSSSSKVQFSINIGDINPNGVVVSISNTEGTKTFTIKSESETIQGLTNYNGSTPTSLPGKNSGATYLYSWPFANAPDSIEISPIISGTTCSSSDSISPIANCNLFY